jgi:scyllo-inositol 2-dehydrogenase (NADP+)
MKQLKTVVVGLGRIGWQFHLKQAHEHEGFSLVGVVDPVPDRLQEAWTTYNVDGFPDMGACLAATKPDLVAIASPTNFHVDQAILAFKAGCDVFCDKPIAPSLEEADRMIESARGHGRKLMVYQPHRATPAAVAIRDLIGRGLIGPVRSMKFRSSGYVRRNDWQAFVKNGGGMLNNYGAHLIDQALHFSGSKAARISCLLRTIASLGDADDYVKALIETESGTILDIEINQASALDMPRLQIFGQHGAIVGDDDSRAWKVRYFDPDKLGDLPIQESLAAVGRKYPSEEIPWQEAAFKMSEFKGISFYDRCHDYFAGDQPPFVPIEETREVMRVMDECRKDAAGSIDQTQERHR